MKRTVNGSVRSASERAGQLVVLGNPKSRRVSLILASVRASGWLEPNVVPYLAVLSGQLDLSSALSSGSVLRIESPGEDWQVERELIALGASEPGVEPSRIAPQTARALLFDHGRFRFARERHRGFVRLLSEVAGCLRDSDASCLNPPSDIAVLCDKQLCREVLSQAGVPIPPGLDSVASVDCLRAKMAQIGWTQVFVKPRFGSSASGVVAFRCLGSRQVAITTLEIEWDAAGPRFYNSLRVRKLTDPEAVDVVLDSVLDEGAVVEKWLPKDGVGDSCYDLRILCVGGRARHAVMRQSRTPITNLHLGNQRGDLLGFQGERPEAWKAACSAAEQVASLFSNTISVGVDVMIARHSDAAFVLEVNAFGELLPGVLHEGEDTYTAMLRAALVD